MAENSKIKIIDASVILKWILFDEEYSENAHSIGQQALNKEIALFVPEHTYTEVANVLALKSDLDVASELKIFFDKGFLVTVWHTVEVTEKAIEIMRKFKGVSYYDAIYHALAIIHEATFITADEKYYRQTKSIGHSMLLKDYK